MKTGILGGTFDPVHNGHIMIASEAARTLDLDEVLFIPAALTPLKENNHITEVGHRLSMIRLAIADHPLFRLSTIEIDRAGVSYTVDTMERMKKEAGDADELYFIVGLDSLETLPLWKDPDRLVKLCRLVVLLRPGYDIPHLERLEKAVPGLSESLLILKKLAPDVSATDIRRRVAEGLPVDHLVPASVEEYIRENGLYKNN